MDSINRFDGRKKLAVALLVVGAVLFAFMLVFSTVDYLFKGLPHYFRLLAEADSSFYIIRVALRGAAFHFSLFSFFGLLLWQAIVAILGKKISRRLMLIALIISGPAFIYFVILFLDGLYQYSTGIRYINTWDFWRHSVITDLILFTIYKMCIVMLVLNLEQHGARKKTKTQA